MTSGLRSPLRSFSQAGTYNTTLRVMDVGGTWSDVSVNKINITDDSEPIPIISVNNNVVADRIEILTNQRIIFSAYQTADNVPLEYLAFEWDWGDGSDVTTGVGLYTANHEWGDVVGPNQTYILTLSVSDGVNVGKKQSKSSSTIVNHTKFSLRSLRPIPTRHFSCLTSSLTMMEKTYPWAGSLRMV